MICLCFKKTQTIYGVINSIAIITEPSPALLNLLTQKVKFKYKEGGVLLVSYPLCVFKLAAKGK